MAANQMSRFLQIASSEPCAQSRQRLLERKADQILRRDRFYKRMSDEEREIRTAAQSYALKGYFDPSRSS